MPQIHQIAAVAAEKSVFAKQLLHPAHTLPQAIHPLFRVDAHGVAVRLDVGYLAHIKACQPRVRRQGDVAFRLLVKQSLHAHQHLPQHEEIHRFEDEVQRVDGVSADGIIRQIRNEHQIHVLVTLADAFCRRQAVKALHLDVEENQVIVRRVVLQNLVAVGKQADLHVPLASLKILQHIGLQLLPHLVVVLHDGKPHRYSPLPLIPVPSGRSRWRRAACRPCPDSGTAPAGRRK